MSVSSVTLDEVLAAAQIRGASLVPETSGYLALAIADASARLPFRLEDTMVHLSTEGTVKVARGTDVVEPEECAAAVRDMLARLLARSIGSMPGLAGAARPRKESAEGVEAVIADLEAALVPVNRAAARRALARLARETAKTRDSGRLRRRASREARAAQTREAAPAREPQRREPLPQPREAQPREPQLREPQLREAQLREAQPREALGREPARAPARATEPRAGSARKASERASDLPTIQEAKRQAFEEPAEPPSVDVSFSEPPPEVALASAPEPALERDPTPTEMGAAATFDEPNDPTTIDSVAVVLEQARIAARGPAPTPLGDDEEIAEPRREKRSRRRNGGEASFDAAEKKSVDDLLASFSVSGYDSDGTLKATRTTLKRLAGLDPTPPPPAVALRGLTPPPPRASGSDEVTPVPTARFEGHRRGGGPARVAMVVVGLVIAGLLGHYVPTWFDRTGSNERPAPPANALSQRN